MTQYPRLKSPSEHLQVLAIDDDAEIRDLLASALSHAGRYEVRTADGFDSALAEIDAHPGVFDGIFLDIQMPEVDGIEACSLIRILPEYQHVPIIMLTAMTERRYLDLAFKAGASDYITKPFEIERLQVQFARERRKMSAPRAELPAIVTYSGENGTSGILSETAFQSYILRVSEKSHAATSIRAINVFNIPRLAECLEEVSYDRLVEAAARAIKAMTSSEEPVICYRGLGSFLLATDHRISLDPRAVAESIHERLREDGLDRFAEVLDVFLGQPVSVPSNSRVMALDLIAEAVESVERLSQLHAVVPTYAEWRSERDQKDAYPYSIKQAAFAETLDEFVDEGEFRPWPLRR